MPALEFMAPAMFVALVVFLIIGLPVAFSLSAPVPYTHLTVPKNLSLDALVARVMCKKKKK